MPLARHDFQSFTIWAVWNGFLLTCLLRGMTQFAIKSALDPEFLLTCLLRGMTAIFCVFFAIMPPYTRDRLFNKYIFLFFSDKVSLPRGEPDIVF